MTIAGEDWRELAACRGMDVELFMTERGESTLDAKAVCAGCAVREPCLEHALGHPAEKFGVWGGMSERERRQIRRRRRASAA